MSRDFPPPIGLFVLTLLLAAVFSKEAIGDDPPATRRTDRQQADDELQVEPTDEGGNDKKPDVRPSGTEATVGERPEDVEFRRKVDVALSKRTSVELLETPLADVVQYLSRSAGIDVSLDRASLDDVGVAEDTPVTLRVKDVTLRSVLNLMLRDIELTWCVRDESLLVTTPESASTMLTTRVHNVVDLVYPSDSPSGSRDPGDIESAAEDLIRAITCGIAPDSWDNVGGSGSIDRFQELLVVSQTDRVQHLVDEFLDSLRKLRDLPGDATASVPLGTSDRSLRNQELERMTRSKQVTLDYIDVPLRDAMQHLSELTGGNFVLDAASLEDVGIDSGVAVSLHCRDITLHSALARMLRQLELTYVVRDEVILITTVEQAEVDPVARLYPAGDLARGFGDEADYDSLIRVLTTTVAPETWDDVGGPATVEAYPRLSCLIVSQDHEIHDRIAGLLHTLRRARQATTQQQRESLRAASEARESRPETRVYQFVAGLNSDGETAAQIVKLARELLDDGSEGRRAMIVQAVGDRIVVHANQRTQVRVASFLSKFGLGTSDGFSFAPGPAGFGGGGGGFFRVEEVK